MSGSSPAPRWAAVRAWRDALRAHADGAPTVGLSAQGARLALDLSLGALTDDALARVAAQGGEAFDRATVITARTVATASLEWLAVLLGRGTAVTLKHPTGLPGLGPWLVDHAIAAGLPLALTDDRAAARDTPLVIVMGDDATVRAVRETAEPGARVLGFGHRFSVAWWGADLPADAAADALALDVAAHDTRGCMSPAVVLTDAADAVVAALTPALERAQGRWPRGHVAPAEHAAIRTRDALAAATGQLVRGEAWRIHRVPASHLVPVALPRCVQVVGVATPAHAQALLAPWAEVLSTQATAGVAAGPRGPDLGAPRTCALGTMQAPPLVRHHDGVDHLRAMVR
ncbi:MAG: hypothetical protein H6733_08210 [Alphaproteobacteria bacterium]|nr:hypothetical protein [Alphaproteobacteria bacterium]